MFKFKKLVLSIFSFIFIASMMQLNLEAKVVKRVLLEENTGAWCGKCPRGLYEVEKLEIALGKNFIPIAIHDGDPMKSPYSEELIAKWKLDDVIGFPCGYINRIAFDEKDQTSIMLDPSQWESTCHDILAFDSAIVDVKILSWKIDKETKKLDAEIEASFEEDYKGQLAFNLYIVEDGQTGPKDKWAQANDLSKMPEYIHTRFYFLPMIIEGFKHENVLLHMADGAFGSPEGLPNEYEKGKKYTKKYTVDLTKLSVPYQNLDNIWIAAMIIQHGEKSFEIMNSASVGKIPYHNPKPSNPVEYANIDKKTTISKKVVIDNPFDKPMTVKLSLNSTASDIPEGWSLKIKDENKVIPAKSKETFDIDITSGEKAAYAAFYVSCKAEDGEGFKGGAGSLILGFLSKGADAIIYKYGDPTIKSIIEKNAEFKNVVAVPFDSVAVRTFDNSTAKVAILSDPSFLIYATSMPSTVKYLVDQLLTSKIPFIFASESALFVLAGKDQENDGTPATYSVFTDKLKISATTGHDMVNLVDTNYYYLKGEIIPSASHGISNNLPNPIIVNDNMDENANEDNDYCQYLCTVASLDNKVSQIFMHAKAFGATPNDTNGVAAAITLSESKALYYGFNLGAIGEVPVRTVLLNNSIAWLLGKVSVEGLSNNNSADIKIAPNPSSNFAEISLNIKEGDLGKLYISDINGRVVKYISAGDALQSNYKVDLNSFPSGNYYIVAEINGLSSVAPLVIKK